MNADQSLRPPRDAIKQRSLAECSAFATKPHGVRKAKSQLKFDWKKTPSRIRNDVTSLAIEEGLFVTISHF